MTARVLELAEAGQRLRYGDEAQNVLTDLLLDWQGGRKPSAGFDQLIRATNAGLEWRAALFAALNSNGAALPVAALATRAANIAGRGERWDLLAHDGGALKAVALDALNPGLISEEELLPGNADYAGAPGAWFVAPASDGTTVYGWDVVADAAPSMVSLLRVDDDGSGELLSWNLPAATTGDCFRLASDNRLTHYARCDAVESLATIDPNVTPVTENPPALIAAVQDIAVNVGRPRNTCIGPGNYRNYGNVLAVLFSKPMAQSDVNVSGAYAFENGNFASSVQIQPGGRVALLNMAAPFGQLRDRTLTVTDVSDGRGNPLSANSLAVTSVADNGVALKGRVALANGTPAAGVPVTMTMYDAEQTGFECLPYTVRNTQVFTDSQGNFSFDFVLAGMPYSVSATNTVGLSPEAIDIILDSASDNAVEAEKLLELASQPSVADTLLESFLVGALPEAIALAQGLDRALLRDEIKQGSPRVGTEVPVALRFRGRGTVTGVVVDPSGNPVAGAAVNLFPDQTSRELGRGVLSDTSGRFSFFGVPLGVFTVEATAPNGNSRIVSEEIVAPDEVKDLVVELTSTVIPQSTLRGRVFDADAISGHGAARVFVGRFINGRFTNVVAVATAGPQGFWSTDSVPEGLWDIVAVSFDGKTKGERRDIATLATAATNVDIILQGRTTITGRVEFADGQAVPNALVAGGDMIATTDANGAFSLSGVPTGRSTISAGVAANPAAGIDFTRLGNASVDIVPGIDNFVVVRLEPRGRIVGQVIDAAGQPAAGVNVAAPLPDGSGFLWTTANDEGVYSFDNLPLREYVISAPAPPAQDKNVDSILETLANPSAGQDEILAAIGEAFAIFTGINDPLLNGEGENFNPLTWGFTNTALTFDGQTVVANVQYLREGTIAGKVLNGQGVPIGARVRLTGTGPDPTGAPTIIIRGERNSDPALGVFEFPNQALVGDWGIQVASPFYSSVISTSGRTTQVEPDVTDLVMQFPPTQEVNGRLAGTVLDPSGQLVGAGVKVAISFGDLEIQTDDNGRFDTQIDLPAINDRGNRLSYTVIATDDQGLTGRSVATLTPGQTTEVVVRLLDTGGVVVTVVDAGGMPVNDATVDVRGGDFPFATASGVSNANGEALFSTLFAGRYAIDARVPSGPTTICARGSVTIEAGVTRSVTVTLAPTGTINGLFVDTDGTTPIAAAQIAVGSLGFATTDDNGQFSIAGIPIGTYKLSAVDPINGRLAIANVSVSFEGEVVNAVLRVLPLTQLSGTVINGYGNGLVAGASVTASFSDGITLSRTVTTDNSGAFVVPGVPPGVVKLTAVDPIDARQQGFSSANIPEGLASFSLDVKLRALADVEITVFESDGQTVATDASVTIRSAASGEGERSADTDETGVVRFSALPLAPVNVTARSKAPLRTRSVGTTIFELQSVGTAPPQSVVLRGVGSVTGRLLASDGATPISGREVRVIIDTPGFQDTETVLSGADGAFEFVNIPLGDFRLNARDGALAASESATISQDGEVVNRDLILSPSGTVVGRLLRADGTPAAEIDVVLGFTAPSGLLGISVARTNELGEFEHLTVPVGPFELDAAGILFSGIFNAEYVLTSNGETLDVGDLTLDEANPFVIDAVPFPGADDVPIDTTVVITMSEAIDPASVDPSGIYIRGEQGQVPATVALAADGNGIFSIIEITPNAPLASEQSYEAVIVAGEIQSPTGGVVARGPTDLVGRPLTIPAFIPFVTRDDDPPGLLSVTPAPGDIQIATEGVIRISFDEPISPDGLDIEVRDANGDLIAGRVDVGVDGLVAVFTPDVFFAPNGNFTVVVNGVMDLAGNAYEGEPIATNFATLDTIGPEISSLTIKDGVSPVAESTIIIEAQLATLEDDVAIRLSEDLIPVAQSEPGVLELAYVVPASGSVNLRAIAIDSFGNEGPSSPVLTINVVENQPPQVIFTQIVPASGAVPSGSEVQVLLTATDDAGVVELQGAVSGACAQAPQTSNGESLILTCAVPTTAGPTATLTFLGQAFDGSGLTSGEQSLNINIADGTPPAVTIIAPALGTAVAAGQSFTVSVDALDNFALASITLTTDGAFTHSETQTLNNGIASVTFEVPVPDGLDGGEDFNVVVTVTDTAGFSTNSQLALTTVDLRGPILTSLQPAADATGRSVVSSIRATFDEPLAAQSIDANVFRLADNNGEPVAATVTLSDDKSSIVLTPVFPLARDATYQLTLEAQITDESGNAALDLNGELLGQTIQQFTTGSGAMQVSATQLFAAQTLSASVSGNGLNGAKRVLFYVDGELMDTTGLGENVVISPPAPAPADAFVDWVSVYRPGLGGSTEPLAVIDAPSNTPNTLVYFEDFENGAGPEWSDQKTEFTNGTTRFLGRFNSPTGIVANFAVRTDIDYRLLFDIWALDSIDGAGCCGPDRLLVDINYANVLDVEMASEQTDLGHLGFSAIFTDGVIRDKAIDIHLASDEAQPLIPHASYIEGSAVNAAALLIDGVIPLEASNRIFATNIRWENLNTAIVVDYGAPSSIDDVIMSVDFNDAYAIEYSVNASDWFPLASVTTSNGEITSGMDTMSSISGDAESIANLDFAAVEARFLKLSASGGDSFYAAGELAALALGLDAARLSVRFYDNGLQGIGDESWGLDNVRLYSNEAVNLAGGSIVGEFVDNLATNGAGADIRLHVNDSNVALPQLLGQTESGAFVALTINGVTATSMDFDIPDGFGAITALQIIDNNDTNSGLRLVAIEALHPTLFGSGFVLGAATNFDGTMGYPIAAEFISVLSDNGDEDGDGIPNADEISLGLDPLVSDIGRNDDADELSNVEEYLAGTDPFNPDSDGDGIFDHLDSNPTDPNIAPIAGPIANALLAFDGSDDYVMVSDSDELALTQAVTVEAWVQVNNGDPSPHLVLRTTPNDGSPQLEAYKLGINGRKPEFRINHTDVFVVGPEDLIAGRWYHLAGSYDGQTVRVYVDGVEVASASYSQPILSTVGGFTTFGADIDDGGAQNQFLRGGLDEVRVWSVARSAAEIANARFSRLQGSEQDLVGYWNFDRVGGGIVVDQTANENHGILGAGVPTQQPARRLFDRLAEVDDSVHPNNKSALAFNGNDAVVVQDAQVLDVSTFTFEAWVNYVDNGASQILINKENAYEVAIFETGNINWAIANGSPGNWAWNDTGVNLDPHQWHHVAVSFNGTQVRTYVNGMLASVMSHSAFIPATTTTFRIGAREFFDTQYFVGMLDEVRLWDVVRTADEIAANVYRPVTADAAGLVGSWRFNEASGDSASDEGPNNLHGVLGRGTDDSKPLWARDVPLVLDGGFAAVTEGVDFTTVNWTDWQSGSSTNGFTAVGTIATNDGPITVTYNNPQGIAFLQADGGTDYWSSGGVRNPATSPYTSIGPNGVANIPTTSEIVGLSNAGLQTLTFSRPVSNPYFSYVSLNGNGYGFDRDFEILSYGSGNVDGNGTDACGYWGCGTSFKQFDAASGEYRLLGSGEPHGTLRLAGNFDQVSWRSLSNEFWNGFTVGVKGAGSASIVLHGQDPNLDVITAVVSELPAHGTLYQTSDGVTAGAEIVAPETAIENPSRQVIYKPNAGYIGPDSFGYYVNDGFVTSSPVIFDIVTASPDSDADGLSDTDEINIYKTDPFAADSDGDLLSDFEEINGTNSNPLHPDEDYDGIIDGDDNDIGSGNATPVTGLPPSDYVLSFDGVDDYVEVPGNIFNSPQANNRFEITLETWVLVNGLGAGNHTTTSLIGKGEVGGWEYTFGFDENFIPRFALFNCSGTTLDFVEGGQLTLGTWHHLAATYAREGDIALYLDGVEVARQTSSGQTVCLGNRPVRFGDGQWPDYRALDGNMADVRIWDRVRSAQRIAASRGLRLSDNSNDGNNLGLISYYRIAAGSGTVVTDFSVRQSDAEFGPGVAMPAWRAPRSETVAPNGALVIDLVGTDADDDPLGAVISALPTAGTMFQTSDGVNPTTPITTVGAVVTHTDRLVIYQPDTNFVGFDSFSYYVDDGFTPSGPGRTELRVLGADTDGDGLSDADELATYGTNPSLADTDDDGLSDGEEINTFGTDPLNEDTDGDGLIDGLDPSPQAVNLAPVAGSTFATSVLSFDGQDDYVEIDQDLSPHATGDKQMTLEAWVNVKAFDTDNHAQNRAPIISKAGPGQYEYGLYVYDTGEFGFNAWTCLGANMAIVAGSPQGSNEISLDRWYHVAATWRAGGQLKLYVDGELIQSVFIPTFNSSCDGTSPIRIGSRVDGQFLNADIDEVKIWDIERTAAQIAASYHGSPFARAVLGDEPIAYYRFNDVSGDVAFDSSGNRRHGDYNGDAELGVESIESGLAARFNGQNTSVDLPGSWGGTSSATLEALFKVEVNTGNFQSLLISPTVGQYIHFQMNSGINVIYGNNTFASLNSPTVLPDASWHHLMLVAQPGNSKIFLDGGLVVSSGSNYGSINPTQDLNLGGKHYSRWFAGLMDEVAIYNRALSDAEVAEHFAASVPESNTGLLGYWRFDDAGGSILTNEVVGGESGILGTDNNSPVWRSSTRSNDSTIVISLPQTQGIPIRLLGADLEKDTLEIRVLAPPANGALYQTTDGTTAGSQIAQENTVVLTDTVLYIPDTAGRETIEFVTDDGNQDSATATINLVVLGDDTDLDGLSDSAEYNQHGTDPFEADTDGDGLNDGVEINELGTNPLSQDTDGDGTLDAADAEPLLFGDLVQPDSATASSEFSDQFDIGNTIDGSGLPANFSTSDEHETYVVDNHWTTAAGQTIGTTATFEFNTPKTLRAFVFWNHRSDNISANGNYEIVRYALTLRNQAGDVIGEFPDNIAKANTAKGQVLKFPANIHGIKTIEFTVLETEANNASPYTGLGEVAVEEIPPPPAS